MARLAYTPPQFKTTLSQFEVCLKESHSHTLTRIFLSQNFILFSNKEPLEERLMCVRNTACVPDNCSGSS